MGEGIARTNARFTSDDNYSDDSCNFLLFSLFSLRSLHCKRSISSRPAQILHAVAHDPGLQFGHPQLAARYWLLGTDY